MKISNLCSYFALTAAAIFSAAASLFADDNLFPTDTLQRLEESVVVAYRQPEKTIPAQTMQGETLKKLNSLSVADAIRYFSGVQIKDYGGVGGLKTINVRSLGSQHVGVFYDGVQIGNAQNGQVDLGRFSLDNMESVTLYNGQKSTGVQSAKDYASASAVYLRTRKPVFKEGRRYSIATKLSGGSFGTFNPSILWEQKIGNKVSNSFNAEYLTTTGKYKFTYTRQDGTDTSDVRRNGDVRAVRVEDGLFGDMKNGEWKAKVYFYDSQRGYPGAVVREEPGRFRHEDRQWDTDFFTQASLLQEFGRYKINASIKYAYDYLHYLSDPRVDVSTMYVDNHYRQQEGYASVSHEVEIFEWWDIDLATDWQYNTLTADLRDFAYPSRNTLLAALSTSFRFRKIKIQASGLYTFVHDATRVEGAASEARNKLTPTAVVQYIPFDNVNFSLRAFYKKIFRMPTMNDLYYTFIGNKNLKPEYTTQYNLGTTYSNNWMYGAFRKIDLTVDAYYNEVENKIVAMPTSNQFQWTMMNLGFVRIFGTDVAASTNISICDKVFTDVRLTYTYQRAMDCTDPKSLWYKNQIPYIPWNSGSAVIGLTYGRWNLNYSFLYTGERYNSTANIPENYEKSWRTSDMSVSGTFDIRNAELKATVEVNNIFNQRYEVVRCYPMPGTNFKIILTVSI